MIDAVLHPATKRDLDALLQAAPHALALIGPAGIGKGFVAEQLAKASLRHDRNLSSHPFFLHIVPQKQVIGIEDARQIAGFLKLKTTGAAPIRRLVLIEHADAMTTEAQNALLKNIEEPPADTVIILTLDSRTSVRPTILSRLQAISVRTPAADELKKHLSSQGYAKDAIDRTLLLCDGLPGLATALLSGDESNDFVDAINVAKKLLASDTFTRLAMVDEIVAAKQTERVVAAILHVAQAALVSAAGRSSANSAAKRWASIASQAGLAADQLKASAQAKLVLTNLCIHM